jgi:hypothetical protein
MRSVASRFGPALKAFLLCLLIGGSGVGYVWQKDQLRGLGQQIKKREQRLAELEEQNEKLRKQLATMRSPRFLEMRSKELNLGLVPPQPNQVWRMAEPLRDQPPAVRPMPERETQYARASGGPARMP